MSSDLFRGWARLDAASFLTDDEKRAAAGYGLKDEEVAEESGGPFAHKYNPNQPRVPAGNRDGGQWTDGGGGGGSDGDPLDGFPGTTTGDADNNPIRLVQLVGPLQYSVDLLEQEAQGGHTLRRHVGAGDEQLLAVMRAARFSNPFYTIAKKAEGSFFAREAANDFVNQVLQANKNIVDQVAAGTIPYYPLETRFGYVTGKEAFRPNADAEPYMRSTYAVRVVIRHDASQARRFSVISAFPINQEPKKQ